MMMMMMICALLRVGHGAAVCMIRVNKYCQEQEESSAACSDSTRVSLLLGFKI
jgi:hypothetical protein